MPELLKKLLAALGLPETATDAEATAALDALTKKAGEAETAQAACTAMKSAQPDPSKFVSVAVMEQMQTSLAALTSQLNGDKVEKVVGDALAVGKLLPAQVEWAKDLGKTNFAALTAYVEKTPANPALLGTQTDGKAPDGGKGTAALTAAEISVCKATGVSQEDFLKTKSAEA